MRGALTGRPTRIGSSQDSDVTRSLQRENDTAAIMAGQGYQVQLNPTPQEVTDARVRTGTPLKPPNNRHNLNNIRPNSPSKARNTVMLPGTDVAKDLDDIAAGRATWNAERNFYEINGRTYGVEGSGTVYPISGAGFVNLSRSEYKVLKQLIASDGDINAAHDALRRDPSVREADWAAAMAVFTHHKGYKGGA